MDRCIVETELGDHYLLSGRSESGNAMIEFKGAYYKSKTASPQSVLVQFDGVVLHIWNISTPFHRILSSEAFRLPFSLGRQRCWVRLPNGSRIETEDLQSLALLKSSCQSDILPYCACLRTIRGRTAVGFSALAAVLTTVFFAYWLFR
jgi:hypothetical protein